jgi:hypothetical protein
VVRGSPWPLTCIPNRKVGCYIAQGVSKQPSPQSQCIPQSAWVSLLGCPKSCKNLYMIAFLWTGTYMVQRGKCLVAWKRVQHPLCLGGLGVLDLKLFGTTLCAHWLWLKTFRTGNHVAKGSGIMLIYTRQGRCLLQWICVTTTRIYQDRI